MEHKNIPNHGQGNGYYINSQELIVPLGDYVRLRKLAGEHELAEELDRAIVVSADRIPKNVVTMHSRLIYSDETTGTKREVQLVYPGEANPLAGRVSVLAPVGCALLGLAAGQSIDWEFPEGKMHRLRVERILFQPETISEDRLRDGQIAEE